MRAPTWDPSGDQTRCPALINQKEMADLSRRPDLYEKIGSISMADDLSDDEPRPGPVHHWRNTPQALIGIAVVVALSTALFFGVAHASLSKIYVAGIPIKGNSSKQQIQKLVADKAKTYKVAVKYPDKSVKTYTLAETGITVDASKSADHARDVINQSLVQRLQWWEPIKIDLVTVKNKKVNDAFVAAGLSQVQTPPVDAGLSLDDGKAVITPEKPGQGSKVPNADASLTSAVKNLSNQALVLKPAVLPVSIKSTDLGSSRQKAQTYLDKSVVFNIAGHAVTASPADIAGWLDVTPVSKAKTVDVNVNSGKVLTYINSVAKRYITMPRSRLITQTDQGQVVLDPGADGVDVVAKDKTATDVASRLGKEDSLNIDLAVQYSQAKTVTTQPYEKWFVADVTNKRMYAYEGTNLVHSFLISAGAPATPTVIGTYKIYSKFASQDMRGNNADGSRYFQPAVPYVNYFYGGYAIHGNYWRPASYFGNINSSHGCIGINVADAEWIYNWATIGTVVITHT